MSKDIYMPALGMSQDTGVIAEWHKKEGDAVAVGDAVMSVETDKAVQEIEANAAGFIGQIFHPAGAEVPVGEVIATIVEQPGEVSSSAASSQPQPVAEPLPTEASNPPAATASKSIYMPALGMSQDTGVIAEWHKKEGDPVAVGDAVMSVETDKAVQEIEANAAGFIGQILYPAGAEVPVGEVIATIVEQPGAVGTSAGSEAKSGQQPAPPASPKPAPSSAATSAPKTAKASPAPKTTSAATSPAPSGRPLASPKAKRLAQERGIDIAILWEQCHFRPVLAEDVQRYQASPTPTATTSVAARDTTAHSGAAIPTSLTVNLPTTRLLAFVDWLGEQRGEPATVGMVAARFLAGVWRRHGASDESIDALLVAYADRAWTRDHLSAVEQGGLLSLWERKTPAQEGQSAMLTVVDFTRSSIRSAASSTVGNSSGCLLTFASNRQEILTVTVVSQHLDMEALAPITSELAELLEEPLNALLF